MVINVCESMLFDVGDTNVLMGVNITSGGNKFTGEDVDESRLAQARFAWVPT